MARRLGANATMANVQTVEHIIDQVGRPFQTKQDPFRKLAEEIEKCRKKISKCVGDDGLQRQAKKPKTAATEHQFTKESSAPSQSAVVKAYQSPKKGICKANVEFRVNAMKVAELKKELKSRGLDVNGLKKDLRARLLNAIVDEPETQQNNMIAVKAEPMKLGSPMPMVENIQMGSKSLMDIDDKDSGDLETKDASRAVIDFASKKVEKDDVVSKDVQPAMNESQSKSERVSCSSTQAEADHHCPGILEDKPTDRQMTDAEECTHNIAKPAEVPKTKKEELESSSQSSSLKRARSPLRGMVKNASQGPGNSPANAEMGDPMKVEAVTDTTPEDATSPPSSEVGSSCSKISGTRVREIVSKMSNQQFSSTASSSQNAGSTSALSKNLKAKKEARLARMAEMRGKSKPLGSASKTALTPKDYTATVTSLSTTSAPAAGHKKNLAAQMREKAAAASVVRKENVPANARNLPMSNSTVPDSLGSTLKQGLGTTLKTGFSLKNSKVSSPMDTYEISDREDSGSDESDSEAENEKQKKKIPMWAKRENLLPALEEQYNGCVEGHGVDPDELFPEVSTCDLEAIFGNKKTRYTRRTSSGNWNNDKVTAAEVLVYKRKMGFVPVATEV